MLSYVPECYERYRQNVKHHFCSLETANNLVEKNQDELMKQHQTKKVILLELLNAVVPTRGQQNFSAKRQIVSTLVFEEPKPL